jgi:hypothetical protein
MIFLSAKYFLHKNNEGMPIPKMINIAKMEKVSLKVNVIKLLFGLKLAGTYIN